MSNFLRPYRLKNKTSPILTAILLVVLFFVPTATNASLQAAAIAQSFEVENSAKIVEGTLVSLKSGGPGVVEMANSTNAHQLIGVVGEKPLAALTSSTSSVQVITGGVAVALVSDIEGEIKTGDKITASPIAGVGMKASSGSMVIGTAQADLASVKTTEHSITDVSGKVHTVKVGLIPTQVDVTFYSETGDKTYVPAFLQEFADAVAGKQVSSIRILIAVLVLLLAFVSIAVLLYAAVKSSIISIGRNPLSEGSVRKGLWQAGLTTVGILTFTIVIVLLVLRT